jgi:hypothetical protein
MQFLVPALPVVVGAVAIIAVGMAWYSPLLFAEPWMRAMGITREDIGEAPENATGGYITSSLMALVQAYGLAVGIHSLGLGAWWSGALLGAGVWLAFNFSVFLRLVFFEDRPLTLVWINGAYDLVSFALAGAIIGVWR